LIAIPDRLEERSSKKGPPNQFLTRRLRSLVDLADSLLANGRYDHFEEVREQIAGTLRQLGLADREIDAMRAGRLIEFAHDANRRLLDRANFWRASSACSALR
jgi:hypothetical protein